ncbi:MAG: cytochrome c [Rhodospirillaceae bacterium]|nr:cytochrome c [Rhodospirillaceae bacterium]
MMIRLVSSSLLGALLWTALPAQAQEQAAPAEAPAAATTAKSKGEYLATVGNCHSCHTKPGGAPFAGGVPFTTDFGTIYSTNITSDPKAGIGDWTKEQFIRAMREGIDNEGKHLYPAFPYPNFTKVSDEDLNAIYDYIKTVPASTYVPPENKMPFPFNQRGLMAFWNALFFKTTRFTPDTQQSVEFNRGAYIVEGLAHCGACHTPRNILGGEKTDLALSGGTFMDEVSKSNEVRPWYAVNLTPSQDGLKAWKQEDIVSYMKTGHGGRVGSHGPMNEVIAGSTMKWTDEDIAAVATYLKGLKPIERGSTQAKFSDRELGRADTVYTIHCGTCHLPTGMGSTPGNELGAPLVGNPVVQGDDPSSLINVILYGVQVISPAPPKGWQNMKAFDNVLDDDEVAMIANYIRTQWGNKGSKVTEEQVEKQRLN